MALLAILLEHFQTLALVPFQDPWNVEPEQVQLQTLRLAALRLVLREQVRASARQQAQVGSWIWARLLAQAELRLQALVPSQVLPRAPLAILVLVLVQQQA
jgi:hypothetical protein